MELTKETEHGSGKDGKNPSAPKKKRRFRGLLCFFFVLALLCVVCATWLHFKITTEPIDARNASTVQAVGWLTMRDLSLESEETREELLRLYLGGDAIPDVSGESGDRLELSENVKKMTSVFLKDRDKQIEAWSLSRVRAPYLRLDYLVVPRSTESRASRFVLSTDVQAGPSLKARFARNREAQAADASRKSCVEKNVQLMVMQWFVSRRNAYDAASDDQKRQKLEEIADELNRMQKIYDQLKGTGGASSRVRSLREFESTVESWNEIATVDELAKALWFKDLLVSVTASRTTGALAGDASYPPLFPEKQSDSGEESAFGARFQAFRELARNYFFDASKQK